MAFQLFPDLPVAPVWVDAAGSEAAATVSPAFVFAERIGGDNRMFLQVAVLADGNPPPEPPAIAVAADTGDPVDVPDDFTEAPVFGLPGKGGGQIASIKLVAIEADDVRLIRVAVFDPGHEWSIRFANRSTSGRRGFIWVVADNEPQTRQPWIDADTAAEVEAFGTETVTTRVRIANHGTGPLRLTDPAGTALGAGFVLSSVAPREVSPGGNADARLTFTDTEPPGPGATVYTVTSNDTVARDTAGHNRRVALIVRKPLVRPGDILVVCDPLFSLRGVLFRIDPATGEATELTAGDQIRSARGVTVDPDGDIYVTESGSAPDGGGIIRVDRFTGRQSRIPTLAGELPQPSAIAFEKRGTIIVITRAFGLDGGTITRVDPRTGQQNPLASGRPMVQPSDVALDRDGTVLVADLDAFGGAGGVIRIDPDTGAQSTVFTASEPFFAQSSLAGLPDGRVVVAGSTGIFTINPVSGVQSVIAHDLAAQDLAVEPRGSLVVTVRDAQTAGTRIVRLEPFGARRSTLHLLSGLFLRISIAVVPARTSG